MIKRTIAIYRRVPTSFARDVLLPLVITRVALTLVAWLGFRLLPLSSGFPLSWEIGKDGAVHRTTTGAPSAHSLINMWSRWDSGWYLEIAKSGYNYEPGKPSGAAFFPLYPAVTRAFQSILFLPKTDLWYLVAGLAVSNISLLVTLAYLYVLVRLEYNDDVARRAVFCLLLFRTTFFLSSVYSESTFLALSISSFYYARKAHWIAACVLAALAALCRSQGIILLLPLLTEYFAQRKLNWRLVRWDIAAFGLIPLAVFAFAAYLHWRFGSWSTVFHAQQPWGRRFLAPWYTLSWVLGHISPLTPASHDWLDLGFFALLVAASTAARMWLRVPYAVYLWTATIFFSCWGMLGSLPRFVLVVFPVFILFALLCEKSRAFRLTYLTVCSMLSALLFVMHSQWQWVA